MDQFSNFALVCSGGFLGGVIFTLFRWITGGGVNRWRQHRLVEKLRREHWKRFDAAALVKAPILRVGHIYEFVSGEGIPLENFGICGCWRFDTITGALSYSVDSKGVIRMFGYTKADLIYVAEHASEFVGA